jgi:hypothetical protein
VTITLPRTCANLTSHEIDDVVLGLSEDHLDVGLVALLDLALQVTASMLVFA